MEGKKREKRRARFVDPDMGRHLQTIAEAFGEQYALAYRLRCSGNKLVDIGAEFGISEQGVSRWLVEIRTLLANARRP